MRSGTRNCFPTVNVGISHLESSHLNITCAYLSIDFLLPRRFTANRYTRALVYNGNETI